MEYAAHYLLKVKQTPTISYKVTPKTVESALYLIMFYANTIALKLAKL